MRQHSASSITSASLGLLVCMVFSHAWAQTTTAEEETQSVEVKAVKDPAIMPYKMAYETITKVRAASKDKVEMLFRATLKTGMQPVPDLNIYLDGPNTRRKIDISPTGFIHVPLDAAALADGADFVTNKKRGSFNVHMQFVPKLGGDTVRYSEITESIAAARAALAEVVPWYWRIFMPSVREIGICYPDKEHAVSVAGVEESSRPAITEDKDMLQNKIYCASFSAKETSLNKDSVITPAPGWSAIFR